MATAIQMAYIRTMANDIDIDVSSAIYDMRKQFSGLRNSQFNQGVARAINHTLAKAKTKANKEVRTQYKVKASDIRNTMNVVKARPSGTATGTLRVKAKPLPIRVFNPKQTKKGVTVNVTGKRKLIRSAFLATMKSGHQGVWGRGRYSGTDFKYRTKRTRKTGNDLGIDEFFTASAFSMVTNAAVLRSLEASINTDFSNRLAHELSRMGTAI